MFVGAQLRQCSCTYKELLPSASGSDTRNPVNEAGDSKNKEVSTSQPKTGAGFKRLFKGQRAAYRHHQKVIVGDAADKPEPTPAQKKETSKRSLLEWIYGKIKPSKKLRKSKNKEDPESEQHLDAIPEQTPFTGETVSKEVEVFFEAPEYVDKQMKDASSQTNDSCQAGNSVVEDNPPSPTETPVESVEAPGKDSDAPSSRRVFEFKKDVYFFDSEESVSENKNQSNADPLVVGEESTVAGDTESRDQSLRISAQSGDTGDNKQEEDKKEQNLTSCTTVRSFTEDSNLLLDPVESPQPARRCQSELSFKHLSNNFERRMFERCAEIYLNACLRQWSTMKPRGSSESATEDVTEPPTSSTECGTETVPDKPSSQPEAPSSDPGHRRIRCIRFTNWVQERLSRLFRTRIEVTIYM